VQETALQSGKIPGSDEWGAEPEEERGFLHTEKDGEVIKQHIASESGNYMQYFDAIYNAIRNSKLLPVTAQDGLNVIRIIEAAFESSQTQKVVAL